MLARLELLCNLSGAVLSLFAPTLALEINWERLHFFYVLGESHQLPRLLNALQFTLLVPIVLRKCSFELFVSELGQSVAHKFLVWMGSVFCPIFLGVCPFGPLDNNLTFVVSLLLEIEIALRDTLHCLAVLKTVVLDRFVSLIEWLFTETHLVNHCVACLPLLQLLMVVQLILDLQTTLCIVTSMKLGYWSELLRLQVKNICILARRFRILAGIEGVF